MADVTIESSLVATQTCTRIRDGTIYVDSNKGYAFFINSNSATLQYRKTTDGGATWGSGVNVSASAENVEAAAVWPWTFNTTGTLISIAWISQADKLRHRTLDPASDTLSSTVDVASAAVASASGWTQASLTVCRPKPGNICVIARWFTGSPAAGNLIRSTDDGVNWSDRASGPYETTADLALFLPATTGDLADMAIIYLDDSALELSVKMYDDSLNTYTETAIGTAPANNADYWLFDACFSPKTGLIYVVTCNTFNTGTSDLNTYTINPNSIASPTKTAKTDVISNQAGITSPRIQYDEVNNKVRVFYCTGTIDTSLAIKYKESSDGMGSWGSEITFMEGAAGNYRVQDIMRVIRDGASGRVQPMWRDNTADDLITGVTNSIIVGGGLPNIQESPAWNPRLFANLTKIISVTLTGPSLGGMDSFFGAMGQGPPPQLGRIIPIRPINRSFAFNNIALLNTTGIPFANEPPIPNPWLFPPRRWPPGANQEVNLPLVTAVFPNVSPQPPPNPRALRYIVRTTQSQGPLPLIQPPPPPAPGGPPYIPIYRRRRRGRQSQ